MPVAEAPTIRTPPSASCPRVAVGHRRERVDARRYVRGEGREVRDIARPGRHDDGGGAPVAFARPDEVTVRRPADLGDGGARLHWGVDKLGVPLDERDDLGHRHVAVRLGTLVGEAREPALPVGGEQPERVPPLGLPRVRHLAALQHDVVDGTGGQPLAHRQTGMTATDDDRRDVACHGRPASGGRAQRTSTVTLVGLVTMSYTAERF